MGSEFLVGKDEPAQQGVDGDVERDSGELGHDTKASEFWPSIAASTTLKSRKSGTTTAIT